MAEGFDFSMGSIKEKGQIAKDWDVVIIGSGPGGLSAALYAGRARLRTLVIDKSPEPGGTISLTNIMEDYPGMEEVKGEDFGKILQKHAEKFGAAILNGEEVKDIELKGKIKRIKTSARELTAKTVIIATGAKPKWLGVPGEKDYIGKGVSTCAVCDAPFFKGKEVAVVGGGNSALDGAVYISKFASKVYVLHRGDKLKADKIVQERAMANKKIKFMFNTEIIKIQGNDFVNKVTITDNKTKKETVLSISGVFVYIGSAPNSALFKGKVKMCEMGYILTDEKMQTNVEGVYAVGDIRKSPLKQAIVSAGEGAIAGHFAGKYIEENLSH